MSERVMLRWLGTGLVLVGAIVLLGAAPLAAAEACNDPWSNLLEGKTVTVTGGFKGTAESVTDGLVFLEGMPWDTRPSLELDDESTVASVDIGSIYELGSMNIFADCNDTYRVESSTDGVSWITLWDVPTSCGFRTRTTVFAQPVKARHLRLFATGGDTLYSVVELQAFCADQGFNLVQGKLVTLAGGTDGTAESLTDGLTMAEGVEWNVRPSLEFSDTSATATVDLQAVQSIANLRLQADCNDSYRVEGSEDGVSWTALWDIGHHPTYCGFRARSTVLSPPASARYLRVSATGGDGLYSVSELWASSVEDPADIPTLSEWALILLALGLAAVAVRRLRRPSPDQPAA